MRLAYFAFAILTLVLGVAAADETALKSLAAPKTACFGTAVEFVESPTLAAKLAAEQKKLVFVLHVSGHFEDPDFT